MLSRDELLHHYPSRYEDLSQYERGVVVEAKNIYTRSGKTIQKIKIKINRETRELTFFNQPFLIKSLQPGINISLAGNEFEINGPLIHTGRLVPIYPEIKGLSSKWLRRQIYNQLKKPVNDWLTVNLLQKYRLLDLNSALRQIHFPATLAAADQARRRLAFDELLEIQLLARAKKAAWQKKATGLSFKIDRKKLNLIISSLPFNLTATQNQSLREIETDLTSGKPMNRLLQGDVGSGKTVIAALAMYLSYLNGRQAILMAPTEILANQHYRTLNSILAPAGLKIGLITKSTKLTGDILVGTHALLNRRPDRLGLVVIDEQHRFGVSQRAKLLNFRPRPHLLTMTATPIPRTLALTIYAHLNLSTIEPLPGKIPVKTWLVPESKRPAAYAWIKKQISANHSQVFIVYPLINPSEKESMQDIKAVNSEFKRLKQIFPGLKIQLIHGRMKNAEKNKIIDCFSRGETTILAATPVIEVGIDIPGADIIIIENAERFGLAQLHQLRGRIGRRGQTAYCLLFAQKSSSRLKILETETAGIKLAEYDLTIRGQGKIFGREQHGFNRLKLADFSDLKLINTVIKAANEPDLKNQLISAKIADIDPN